MRSIFPCCSAAALALSLGLVASPSAQAGDPDLVLRYGQYNGNYESYGVALRLDPWWTRDFGRWRATWRPELEVNHWQTMGSIPGPGSLNEAGGIALFRIQRGGEAMQPYGELGLGGALLSREHLGNREFSTAFQFSEHVGLGLEFGGHWTAGWRYSHYSNADIKKPNNGMDLQQILVGYRF